MQAFKDALAAVLKSESDAAAKRDPRGASAASGTIKKELP
jgi:hypothetical protein